MRIDAHQHFWHIDRLHYPILSPEVFGSLYRNIEPPELETILSRHDIDGTVVVQAKDGCDETEYLLELAERFPWISGVVGWVELADPSLAARQLEAFGRHPKFKGVRHLIMMEPDEDWLIRPNVLEGLRTVAASGFTFDVGAEFPKHLRHVETIARAIPDLRIVIDHLAKPPIGEAGMDAWETVLAQAAAFPNVYCKVSGLNPSLDIRSAIQTAVREFGVERLMFGSDWPVSTFNGTYEDILNSVLRGVDNLRQGELDHLLGNTARKFYRL